MLFDFPKKRINDKAWFLSQTNVLTFGMVRLITMAISEDECKIYYRFIDEQDVEYTVSEHQVLDDQMVVPTPKYNVGDAVIFEALNDKGEREQKVDIIKYVEIGLYEKGAIEISYVMEHDEDEWVLEDEILHHGEPVTTVKLDKVQTYEDGYTEYDYSYKSDV